ncbi:MAG: peptide deformylase [Anaerolineae bacterium]|jgi:peptide deformylase
MAYRQIIFSNDPLLRKPSRHVRSADEDTQELVDDMIETMHQANGIGLAAVQVSVPQRVIVVEVPVIPENEDEEVEEPAETEFFVLINPELVRTSHETEEGIEGCLSVPGWVGEVERHCAVTVQGMDRDGNKVRIKAEGLLARVFQHEIDHCRGILFIDRIQDPEKIWRVEEGREEEAEAAQRVLS